MLPKSLQLLFSTYEYIRIDDVAHWLGRSGDIRLIQNKIANRLLYPNTVPENLEQMHIDLAILREAILQDSKQYFNINLKKIYIPDSLLQRFPDLKQVVLAFMDALAPIGISYLFLKSEQSGTRGLGTVLKPLWLKKGDVTIVVANRKYLLKTGELKLFAASENRVDIRFESLNATLLSKNQTAVEVFGGEIGVIVDARPQNGTPSSSSIQKNISSSTLKAQ